MQSVYQVFNNDVMKKCLLMFGLLVLVLIFAVLAGLSDNESLDNQTIVEAKTDAHELFME